jgi:hypothetical protein
LGRVASSAVRNYLPELSSHALMGVRGFSHDSSPPSLVGGLVASRVITRSDGNFPQADFWVVIRLRECIGDLAWIQNSSWLHGRFGGYIFWNHVRGIFISIPKGALGWPQAAKTKVSSEAKKSFGVESLGLECSLLSLITVQTRSHAVPIRAPVIAVFVCGRQRPFARVGSQAFAS